MASDESRSQPPLFVEAARFVERVRAAFSFLEDEFGLRVGREEPYWVHYESSTRYVDVAFDRYEIYVNIGRCIESDGAAVEDEVSLRDAIGLSRDPATVGLAPFAMRFGSVMVSTIQGVAEFVPKLAALTHTYAPPLLEGDDDVFDRVRELVADVDPEAAQGGAARRFRELAEEAWQRRDYQTVVQSYEAMLDELPLIKLRPAERRRLDYAQREISKRPHS